MKKKKELSLNTLYRIFIYVVLITLAISIIVPVGWVFVASIKENSEFYGSPWTMPKGIYFEPGILRSSHESQLLERVFIFIFRTL